MTEPPRITERWWPLLRHETRLRAALSPARFVGIAAGRGSGKTEIAKRKLVASLRLRKPWPDARYFYAAPTQPQAKRIAWRDFLALIPANWLGPGAVKVSELTIVTKWGSSLTVVGLDKPQRIEGPQWDGCVIDESCDVKPGTFDRSIMPALVHRRGWAWRIGVPKRYGVGAREFRQWCADAASGQLQDAEAFTWESGDILEQIDPSMLAYARANMDPRDFREQFCARWETAGGAVFYAFSAEANVRPCSYDPNLTLVVGCDFNPDPMAWVIGHRRGQVMEWIDELWRRNTNTPECINLFADRYAGHKGGIEFYLDASSGQRAASSPATSYKLIAGNDRLRAMGARVMFPRLQSSGLLQANPPVVERLASCNAMFRNADGVRRMFVDQRCRRLIADLETRAYKPGSHEPDDAGDVGHISDAMGYAVACMFPITLAAHATAATVIISEGKRGAAWQ